MRVVVALIALAGCLIEIRAPDPYEFDAITGRCIFPDRELGWAE